MRFSTALTLFALLSIMCGCGSEQESLHEHDHEEPDHWPANMQEAADFIEVRVNQLSNDSVSSLDERTLVETELAELIEWTPEVAGDTNLAEVDWVPLYELSESIRLRLQGGTDTLKLKPEMAKLCELLLEAHAGLPSELVP